MTAVLVVLDGVRWQEIFLGEDAALLPGSMPARSAREVMPNLHALAREGLLVGGPESPMHASGPQFVSLPGYTEIFSGGTAHCADNACPPAKSRTFVDAIAEDAALGEVAVVASWPRIGDAAASQPERLVISAGRGSGRHRAFLSSDADGARLLAEGERAQPWPGSGEYRPDRFTAPLAARYLRKHPVRFLFVGLGDPDEHAHAGDYGRYLAALADADRLIAALAAELRRLEREGRETLLVVTTDHGRSAGFREHGAAHPESARVWALYSGRAWRRSLAGTRPRRLSHIAPSIERAFGIRASRALATPEG